MKVYNLSIEFTDGSHGEYTNANIKVVNLKGHKFLRVSMKDETATLNYSLTTINGFAYIKPNHSIKFFRTNGHC